MKIKPQSIMIYLFICILSSFVLIMVNLELYSQKTAYAEEGLLLLFVTVACFIGFLDKALKNIMVRRLMKILFFVFIILSLLIIVT